MWMSGSGSVCPSSMDHVDEHRMHALVVGELGVERRHEHVPLPSQHGHVVETRQHLAPGAARSTFGARMNTAWNGESSPATSTSCSKLSIWRP